MKNSDLKISTLPLQVGLTVLLTISGGFALLVDKVNADIIPTVTAQAPANDTVIYVNPATGTDTESAGTTDSPYKTITFAINQAKPGTTIQLANGIYSDETFPLVLKQGITLQGDESTKGKEVVITGGGNKISPTFAKQNITIFAESDTTITGITVTNPNQRGTGVWVESSNPNIKNNTFTGNNREGVFVTGSGNPIVENNLFTRNGGNGISIARSSQGSIHNNIFQNTGFGLAIGGTSTPSVSDNEIVQNQDGLFISESAKPILRNNKIQDNKRDGVVVIGEAVPDLGTSAESGGNTIRSNGRYDLNSNSSKKIPATGNDIDQKRIVGTVDIGSTVLNTEPPSNSSENQTADNPVETPSSNRNGGKPKPGRRW